MKHLLEILKIVDGAVNADRSKVISYTEQLVGKLEAEGDCQSAHGLRRVLGQGKTRQLEPARVSPTTRLPVDSESRMTLADEEVLDPDDVQVFLERPASETVEEFLCFVEAADKLLTQGVGISPSLMAYGPPGCGKTELARYISARLQLPLLTARTDGLISSYLGSTAKNLRMLFEHAMNRPCVLFLDDFDAVAKLRDDQHELGELKRVVVSLLQNIDALDCQTVLVAATNHEHLLDSAIWRRFAYKVHMDEPSSVVREKLFRRFIGEFAKDKDIAIYVQASEGLTGGDIRQTVEDAKRTAILAGVGRIEETEILRRIAKTRVTEFASPNASLQEKLRKTRDLNPKVFTYRRLAGLFEISVGHVSNLLKRGEQSNG